MKLIRRLRTINKSERLYKEEIARIAKVKVHAYKEMEGNGQTSSGSYMADAYPCVSYYGWKNEREDIAEIHALAMTQGPDFLTKRRCILVSKWKLHRERLQALGKACDDAFGQTFWNGVRSHRFNKSSSKENMLNHRASREELLGYERDFARKLETIDETDECDVVDRTDAVRDVSDTAESDGSDSGRVSKNSFALLAGLDR